MALLDKSKANYAFKSLLGKSHTSNDRELYNEAIPSGIILSGSRIFGNDINPTPNDVSNAGIVSDLLTLILEPVSGSDTVTVGVHLAYRTKIDSTVPSSLIGKINPLTKLEYAPDDYIGNIIPQSFGDSFRPLLFSDTNATIEIPPSSSADWFIDCFAGIVVQESDAPFDLNTNGRVKAYVYIGDFLSAIPATPTLQQVLTAGNSMGATQQIQSLGGLSLLQLRDAYIFLQIGTSLLNLSEFINIINNSNNSFIQSSTGGTLITRQDPLYTIKKTELFINPDDIGVTAHTVLNQDYINIVLDALTGSFKYKKYVSNILTQEIDLLSSATQTTTDQYFTSSVVTGAISSTGATVTFATELKQIPLVFINGLKIKVGFDATPSNNLCFFGANASTVRADLSQIQNGDFLFWNPLFANSFDLVNTDEVNLVYNKI